MPIVNIDLDTIQPNGKPGDPARTAFAKVNSNFDFVEERLEAIGGTAAGAVTQQQLQVEVAAREAAVQAEIDARTAAVLANTNAIGTKANQTALQAEIDARTSADKSIRAFTGRNVIINGAFDIWQRGTSSSLGGYSSVDRFVNNVNLGTTTLSRISLSPEDFGASVYSPQYALRAVVNPSGSAAAFSTIQHRVENLARFSARTMTVSFWVRVSNPGQKVVFEVSIDTGAGGSVPAGVQVNNIGTQTFTIASANVWTYVTKTFVMPSLRTVTIANPDLSSLRFNLWLSSGTDNSGRNNAIGIQNGTFDFAMLQLEYGDTATNFEVLPIPLVLSLCQRYYEKSFNQTQPPVEGVPADGHIAAAWSGQKARVQLISYKVTKRVVPAITLYAPGDNFSGSGRWAIWGGSSWNLPSSDLVDTGSTTGFCHEMTFVSGLTTNSCYLVRGNWAADAEI